MKLTLVKTRVARINQPLEEIEEFEEAIQAFTQWSVVKGPYQVPFLKFISRFVRIVGIVLDRLLRFCGFSLRPRAFLSVGYIAPHYLIYKTFPYFSVPAGLRAVWLYDAWENKLDEIAAAILRHRINVLFVSSFQAACDLNARKIANFEAHWLPEAVTVDKYCWKRSMDRPIDILQLGRRWDDYHFRIEGFCREKGFTYLYEKAKGEIIFPTRAAFLEGLSTSKVSICVPSAITHPLRSGRISTMTWRYLQSMASKCLVLGRMPDEMKKMFDYDPMIEIDMAHPTDQLHEILEHFEDFSDLIERNFAYVSENHQWVNRIPLLESGIRDFSGTTG